MISDGKMPRAFATPNTDDPYPLVIAPIHDTKRRVDEFPQKGLIGFMHPPEKGVCSLIIFSLPILMNRPLFLDPFSLFKAGEVGKK